MALDISAFRQVASDTGYLKASKTGDNITKFGNGVLGKIAKWFRDPGATANKQLKNDFVQTLNQTYGTSFQHNQAIKALIGDPSNSKPLSARVVRDVIAMGDKMLLAEKNRPVDIDVGNIKVKHSAYKDHDSLHNASDSFLRQAGFKKEGSTLFQNIAKYVNNPETGKSLLNELARGANGSDFSNFAKAFAVKGSEGMATMNAAQSKQLQAQCLKIGVNPDHISNAAIGLVQIPTRLETLSQTLMTAVNKNNSTTLQQAAQEILNATNAQIETVQKGIDALSHPDVLNGVPKKDAALLMSLKSGLEDRLSALRNPNGPFQHFIAFAAVAASKPEAAVDKLREQAQPPSGPQG